MSKIRDVPRKNEIVREDIKRHVLPFIFNGMHVSKIKRIRDVDINGNTYIFF